MEVANQVALAIANMRSYEEIMSLKAKLQTENVYLQESAALIGSFAAAMSHELNSPIGALRSALETSEAISARKETLPAEKRALLPSLEAELRRTALAAADRLHQTVLRMQRFTNLDRGELLPVDLNALLRDVVDLLGLRSQDAVELQLELDDLPSIPVRPQQMSAVLFTLLHNAMDRANESKHVVVSTRRLSSRVEVRIQDDGKGMSQEKVAKVFQPGFKIKQGRVSTGNWSLFSCRQIVREHGGEIELSSRPAEGTRVVVSLPRPLSPGASLGSESSRPEMRFEKGS